MRRNAISRCLVLTDAVEIRRRRSTGDVQYRIAAAFEVNQDRISEIVSGKRFPAARRLAENSWRGLDATQG